MRSHELHKTENHVLTVLFIGAYDSVNYVFVNLIREFQKREYRFYLVVENPDDQVNNKMFLENQIPMISLHDFNFDKLSELDLVISSPFRNQVTEPLHDAIDRRRIFCISFANLFSSVLMRAYTDLIFTIGAGKFAEFEDNGLHYNMVAVGNPQYDDLIRNRNHKKNTDKKMIKKVLFVDQGGYPFGTEGKGLLGQVLLSMARNHPEMEFVVKPRFLPQEEGPQLHKISEHLYDFIPNPPQNLVLLKSPTILEDLIKEFDAMITMWSTAYLDAALMNLPLMLIRGLPSEEIFDVRNQRIEEAYDRLKDTGCVVDYREVLQGKLEFHYVKETYLREEVGDIDRPCAPVVLDVLEDIYRYLILPGKRLYDVIQTDVTTFRQKLPTLKTIAVGSESYRSRRSFLKYFNRKMQTLVFNNRCMAKPFQLKPLMKYWYFRPKEKFARYIGYVWHVKAYLDINKVQRNYFHSSEIERETDPIRLDHYFDWLYKNGKDHKILNCKNSHVLPETRSYYSAMIALKRRDFKIAAMQYADYYHRMRELPVKPLRRDRQLECEQLPPSAVSYSPFFEQLKLMGEYELLAELSEVLRSKSSMQEHYRECVKVLS